MGHPAELPPRRWLDERELAERGYRRCEACEQLLPLTVSRCRASRARDTWRLPEEADVTVRELIAKRIGDQLHLRHECERLPTLLEPGERLLDVAASSKGFSKPGLLGVTDRRLLYVMFRMLVWRDWSIRSYEYISFEAVYGPPEHWRNIDHGLIEVHYGGRYRAIFPLAREARCPGTAARADELRDLIAAAAGLP